MGAEIEVLADSHGKPLAWIVSCEQHSFSRTLQTERHATNVAQLHDRIDHTEEPEQQGGESFDITAAAKVILVEARFSGQGTAFEGAMAVWRALTGAPETEATSLAYAQTYAAQPVTAHTAPF